MSLRRIAIFVLGALGAGILALMAYMAFVAWQQGAKLEAAGWLTAGFLSLREIVSKIENVSLGLRNGGSPDNGGE